MIYFESPSLNPYFNLACEEYFLNLLSQNESMFMLWQNDKSIVVGKYQNTAEEVNREFVKSKEISVARRLSGGGAVYHDLGNLNYTFIVNQDDASDFNFKHFVLPVVETLKDLGVEAEFTGRNDITIDGKKFSGNSQYIAKGKILHHGCIMLDSNLQNVSEALKVKAIKFESKSTKSVRSRVTTINENLENPITMDEFKNRLKAHILDDEKDITYTLSQFDLEKIEKLRDEKYATEEWNYGRDPKYSVKKENKYPYGLVTCYMDVENRIIKEFTIHGDFFGEGDIKELEDAIKGLELTEDALMETLNKVDVNKYINKMTKEDLIALIIQ